VVIGFSVVGGAVEQRVTDVEEWRAEHKVVHTVSRGEQAELRKERVVAQQGLEAAVRAVEKAALRLETTIDVTIPRFDSELQRCCGRQ